MYRIHKTVSISAAHHLLGVPELHQCARVHGHNYRIEVEVEASELAERTRWVGDFGVISEAIRRYDHQDLNRLLPDSPTAEVFAQELYRELTTILNPKGLTTYGSVYRQTRVVKVRVWETDDSWAEVS